MTAAPGGGGLFTGFGDASLSNNTIAFLGTTGSGQAVYIANNGLLSRIATAGAPIPGGSGAFTGFGVPAANDGLVAFEGLGAPGFDGIYSNLGGVLAPVIDTNAILNGKAIADLSFSQFGFDGQQLAFAVTVLRGSVMHYSATSKRHRTLTELAMSFRRDAYTERICKPNPVLAEPFDRRANELLTLSYSPNVGPGGEVTNRVAAPEDCSVAPEMKFHIRNTLKEGATRIGEEASVRRTDLLSQASFDAVAMAIDAAESIKAENSLEKMLAHQMAVAHEAAMKMMDRGLSYELGTKNGDQTEACRCLNAAARLMSTYQEGLLTLHRLRSGGKQTVTVQHVNVQSGAQAVIGSVQTGGRKRRGKRKNA